jgi:hypothetical protein
MKRDAPVANSKRIIIIYIHPKDGGPITQMQLDVSAIEAAVSKAADGSSDIVGANETRPKPRKTSSPPSKN